MLQTADEVDKLDRRSSSRNRYGHRDAVTVLLAYRYGLRAAELVDRRWEQLDFRTATLHIRRAKDGTQPRPLSGR
jgi:integrase